MALITIAEAAISDGSTTISDTGLEPVLDAMPAVARVFNLTAGAETVTLPPLYFERNWPELPPYTSDDARLRYDGQSPQTPVPADGTFRFTLQRPTGVTSAELLVEETSGMARGMLTQAYEPPTEVQVERYDFGVYGSPVQTNPDFRSRRRFTAPRAATAGHRGWRG